MQLFHKPFAKNISRFANNSNAYRDMLQTCSIWYFYVKFSSMQILKNLVTLSVKILKLSL